MSAQKLWEWPAAGLVIVDGPGLVVFVWHRRQGEDGRVRHFVKGMSLRILKVVLTTCLRGRVLTSSKDFWRKEARNACFGLEDLN